MELAISQPNHQAKYAGFMPCNKSVECPWRYFATVKLNANKSGVNGMKLKLNNHLENVQQIQLAFRCGVDRA